MVDRLRSRHVPVFLSLLAPGLGHLYAARTVQGLTLCGYTAAIGMLGTVAALASPTLGRTALVAGVAAWVVLWIGAAISARRLSVQGRPTHPPTAPSREPESTGDARADSRASESVGERHTEGAAPPGHARSPVYVYAVVTLIAVVSVGAWAIAIRDRVVQMFHVPSGSMEPSIGKGRRILVDKAAYSAGPVRRGDVVVFVNPNERYQTYVKRVAALPGDTIELRDDTVFVNGAALARGLATPDASGARTVDETNGVATYRVRLDATDDARSPRSFGPLKVPSGTCFVLGDNRHHSADSRDVGPIPLADLLGRLMFVW